MLIETFKKRNAKVIVETHGEVLFAPGSELSRWKQRFSANIRAATIREAPLGGPTAAYPRRTLRPHPGPRLKETIRAATRTEIVPGGGRFFIAVGSTAAYAVYVDQGTGIYNGGSPYEAKLLPPYEEGSPTLYEKAPWRKPVFIKGQKGQHFFDKGLAAAFRAMHMRSIEVPGEGIGAMRSSLATFPENLFGEGNTPVDQAFKDRREVWREWKREAYENQRARDAQARRSVKARAKPDRAKQPKPRQSAQDKARIAERIRFMSAVTTRWPAERGYKVSSPRFNSATGRWEVTVTYPNGKTEKKQGRPV